MTGVNLTTNNITVGAGGITTATNGVVTFTNAGTLNVNGNIAADGAVTQNGAGVVALLLVVIVVGKVLAHWLTSGVPPLLAAPLIGVLFGPRRRRSARWL